MKKHIGFQLPLLLHTGKEACPEWRTTWMN